MLISQVHRSFRKDKETNHVNPHPVQVGVWVFWHVVVEDNIDSLNIHSTAEEISGYQDPPLEVFKLLIARQSADSGQYRKSWALSTEALQFIFIN